MSPCPHPRGERTGGGGSRKIHLRWCAADFGWPKKSLPGRREIGQTGDRCALTAQQATAAIRSGGGMIDSEESSSTGGGDTNNAIAPSGRGAIGLP